MRGLKNHLCEIYTLSPLWIAKDSNCTLTYSTPPHPHRCGHQDTRLWLITFSWASWQIPIPKPRPAILIVLLSPLFSPSLCFLDLEEPLILHSDSACLNHAQPFLEPEQREHLQVFVKSVEPCSLNYVQMYNKETCMPYLISPFFLL